MHHSTYAGAAVVKWSSLALSVRVCVDHADDAHFDYYRIVSNIRRTKLQNLNDSRPALQLSLPNPLKSGVKSRMKI